MPVKKSPDLVATQAKEPTQKKSLAETNSAQEKLAQTAKTEPANTPQAAQLDLEQKAAKRAEAEAKVFPGESKQQATAPTKSPPQTLPKPEPSKASLPSNLAAKAAGKDNLEAVAKADLTTKVDLTAKADLTTKVDPVAAKSASKPELKLSSLKTDNSKLDQRARALKERAAAKKAEQSSTLASVEGQGVKESKSAAVKNALAKTLLGTKGEVLKAEPDAPGEASKVGLAKVKITPALAKVREAKAKEAKAKAKVAKAAKVKESQALAQLLAQERGQKQKVETASGSASSLGSSLGSASSLSSRSSSGSSSGAMSNSGPSLGSSSSSGSSLDSSSASATMSSESPASKTKPKLINLNPLNRKAQATKKSASQAAKKVAEQAKQRQAEEALAKAARERQLAEAKRAAQKTKSQGHETDASTQSASAQSASQSASQSTSQLPTSSDSALHASPQSGTPGLSLHPVASAMEQVVEQVVEQAVAEQAAVLDRPADQAVFRAQLEQALGGADGTSNRRPPRGTFTSKVLDKADSINQAYEKLYASATFPVNLDVALDLDTVFPDGSRLDPAIKHHTYILKNCTLTTAFYPKGSSKIRYYIGSVKILAAGEGEVGKFANGRLVNGDAELGRLHVRLKLSSAFAKQVREGLSPDAYSFEESAEILQSRAYQQLMAEEQQIVYQFEWLKYQAKLKLLVLAQAVLQAQQEEQALQEELKAQQQALAAQQAQARAQQVAQLLGELTPSESPVVNATAVTTTTGTLKQPELDPAQILDQAAETTESALVQAAVELEPLTSATLEPASEKVAGEKVAGEKVAGEKVADEKGRRASLRGILTSALRPEEISASPIVAQVELESDLLNLSELSGYLEEVDASRDQAEEQSGLARETSADDEFYDFAQVAVAGASVAGTARDDVNLEQIGADQLDLDQLDLDQLDLDQLDADLPNVDELNVNQLAVDAIAGNQVELDDALALAGELDDDILSLEEDHHDLAEALDFAVSKALAAPTLADPTLADPTPTDQTPAYPEPEQALTGELAPTPAGFVRFEDRLLNEEIYYQLDETTDKEVSVDDLISDLLEGIVPEVELEDELIQEQLGTSQAAALALDKFSPDDLGEDHVTQANLTQANLAANLTQTNLAEDNLTQNKLAHQTHQFEFSLADVGEVYQAGDEFDELDLEHDLSLELESELVPELAPVSLDLSPNFDSELDLHLGGDEAEVFTEVFTDAFTDVLDDTFVDVLGADAKVEVTADAAAVTDDFDLDLETLNADYLAVDKASADLDVAPDTDLDLDLDVQDFEFGTLAVSDLLQLELDHVDDLAELRAGAELNLSTTSEQVSAQESAQAGSQAGSQAGTQAEPTAKANFTSVHADEYASTSAMVRKAQELVAQLKAQAKANLAKAQAEPALETEQVLGTEPALETEPVLGTEPALSLQPVLTPESTFPPKQDSDAAFAAPGVAARTFETETTDFSELTDSNFEIESGVEGELEGELKGELEGELKGELEGELKGELEGELKGELEGELEGELKGELRGEIEDEVEGECELEPVAEALAATESHAQLDDISAIVDSQEALPSAWPYDFSPVENLTLSPIATKPFAHPVHGSPRISVIIPARGGSKRLPRKNILPLGGIPLIAHSILYAQQYEGLIDGIYVSTEDDEIAQVSLAYDAQVIKRSLALASDSTPTLPVLTEAVLKLYPTSEARALAKARGDAIVLLQPTNPLRVSSLLPDALKRFYSQGVGDASPDSFQSLLSLSQVMTKMGRILDGEFKPFNYEIGQHVREMEKFYAEDGAIYIVSVANLLNEVLIDAKACPFVHGTVTCDIDTLFEMQMAESMFYHQRQQVGYWKHRWQWSDYNI